MPNLNPAPSSLGLFSPALGPWFETSAADAADLADLPPPNPDLSVTRQLPVGAIWNAPAAGTLSYLLATATRPPALARLRAADGTAGSSYEFFGVAPTPGSAVVWWHWWRAEDGWVPDWHPSGWHTACPSFGGGRLLLRSFRTTIGPPGGGGADADCPADPVQ